MLLWIWSLRILGLGLLVVGAVARIVSASRFYFLTVGDALNFLSPVLENIAVAVVCFATAAALSHLQRIEHRQAQQAAALRRLLQARQPTQPKDLAPAAPRWNSPLPDPRQELTPGQAPPRRLERQPIPASVRPVPPVANEVPGRDYADPLPPPSPARRPPDPRLSVDERRYLLRTAKDNRQRRQQAGSDE